ncbi:hypothetical protein QQP08_000847 [Theobroma cacao]|nr:hypothetical protein QQP08_000847 [Theobroma cacao]
MQHQAEGACDFQGLAKLVKRDPSNGTCQFPIMIEKYQATHPSGEPNSKSASGPSGSDSDSPGSDLIWRFILFLSLSLSFSPISFSNCCGHLHCSACINSYRFDSRLRVAFTLAVYKRMEVESHLRMGCSLNKIVKGVLFEMPTLLVNTNSVADGDGINCLTEAKEELIKLVCGKCLRVLVYDKDHYSRYMKDEVMLASPNPETPWD